MITYLYFIIIALLFIIICGITYYIQNRKKI
jgi:hypothetical protein